MMPSNWFNKIDIILRQLLVIFSLVLAGISSCSFADNTGGQTNSDSATLIRALRENGVNMPKNLDYDSVVNKLKSMSVGVPESYREGALTYLDRNAELLIHLPTSKAPILSWYFENVLFLRKNLIFASYSDGEMYGGDILIEIIYSKDRVISMRTLWNYHQKGKTPDNK